MKDNKSTGPEITFLSSLYLFFGTFLVILGQDQEVRFFGKLNLKYGFQDFKNQIWYFKLYIYVFNISLQFKYFFFNFD